MRWTKIHAGPRDSQFVHAEVKRRPFDSQACSGPVRAGDNPAGLFESLENVVSLRVLQGNRPRRFRFDGTLQARARAAQDGPRREDYAPLDDILELSNDLM